MDEEDPKVETKGRNLTEGQVRKGGFGNGEEQGFQFENPCSRSHPECPALPALFDFERVSLSTFLVLSLSRLPLHSRAGRMRRQHAMYSF